MSEDIAKELLEPFLNKIGWSLRFAGCDHYYLVNHFGKTTKWCIWKDRLEFSGDDLEELGDFSQSWIMCFNMKKCKVEHNKNSNFVSVYDRKNKAIFVLFMNHEMKEAKQ